MRNTIGLVAYFFIFFYLLSVAAFVSLSALRLAQTQHLLPSYHQAYSLCLLWLLRGSLNHPERWLYLFARKSSGYNADGWVENIESIHLKSGSKTTLHEFRRQIRKILSKGKLLGYDIGWEITNKRDRNGLRNNNLFFARNTKKLIHNK